MSDTSLLQKWLESVKADQPPPQQGGEFEPPEPEGEVGIIYGKEYSMEPGSISPLQLAAINTVYNSLQGSDRVYTMGQLRTYLGHNSFSEMSAYEAETLKNAMEEYPAKPALWWVVYGATQVAEPLVTWPYGAAAMGFLGGKGYGAYKLGLPFRSAVPQVPGLARYTGTGAPQMYRGGQDPNYLKALQQYWGERLSPGVPRPAAFTYNPPPGAQPAGYYAYRVEPGGAGYTTPLPGEPGYRRPGWRPLTGSGREGSRGFVGAFERSEAELAALEEQRAAREAARLARAQPFGTRLPAGATTRIPAGTSPYPGEAQQYTPPGMTWSTSQGRFVPAATGEAEAMAEFAFENPRLVGPSGYYQPRRPIGGREGYGTVFPRASRFSRPGATASVYRRPQRYKYPSISPGVAAPGAIMALPIASELFGPAVREAVGLQGYQPEGLQAAFQPMPVLYSNPNVPQYWTPPWEHGVNEFNRLLQSWQGPGSAIPQGLPSSQQQRMRTITPWFKW